MAYSLPVSLVVLGLLLAPAAQLARGQALANAPLPDYAVFTLAGAAGGGGLLQVAGDPLQNQLYVSGQGLVLAGAATAAPTDAQQWYVAYVRSEQGTRYYQVRNVFSGQLLASPGPGAGTALGQLLPPSTGPANAQLWAVAQTGAAGQYQLRNLATGLAASAAGVGSPVTQEAAAGVGSQRWTFGAQPPRVYRDELANGFFRRDGRRQGSVAFDEGMSIPLHWGPNQGKVVWVTQDAFDGTSNNGHGGLSCGQFIKYPGSLLLQPATTNWASTAPNLVLATNPGSRRVFADVPTSVNQQPLPYNRPWASVGIEIGNHVFIQCNDGRYDNQVPESQSLYDFTETADTAWTVVRTVPQGLGVGVGVSFASGMTRTPGDAYVYAFGSERYSFGYYSYLHVARFLASNPQTWEFWNGPALGWQASPVKGAAASISPGLGSNAVCYVNGQYVLVSMSQGYNSCTDTPRALYVATASSPTAGFAALQKVYDIQEYYQGPPARFYTVGVHPEFVNGHNELLLSYCLNYSCVKGGVNLCVNGQQDPYFYRIKNIRVPYSLVGIPADPTAPLATAAAASAGAGLACYPNPARGATQLDLRGLAAGQPAQLTLSDALGQVVRRLVLPASAAGSQWPFDVQDLAPGSYQVQVEQGGQRYHTRLLLER